MHIVFSDLLRKKLRKPLGRVTKIDEIKTKRKIIAVGDETTLNLLEAGMKPHLAVCDFRVKRRKISKKNRDRIKKSFKKAGKCMNTPGTLSLYLLENAKKYLKKGGLLEIAGEEDITALAFILKANKNHLILYGQPDKGVVSVKPEEAKEKAKRILGAALCHKVK